jgi:hypothetical protein
LSPAIAIASPNRFSFFKICVRIGTAKVAGGSSGQKINSSSVAESSQRRGSTVASAYGRGEGVVEMKKGPGILVLATILIGGSLPTWPSPGLAHGKSVCRVAQGSKWGSGRVEGGKRGGYRRCEVVSLCLRGGADGEYEGVGWREDSSELETVDRGEGFSESLGEASGEDGDGEQDGEDLAKSLDHAFHGLVGEQQAKGNGGEGLHPAYTLKDEESSATRVGQQLSEEQEEEEEEEEEKEDDELEGEEEEHGDGDDDEEGDEEIGSSELAEAEARIDQEEEQVE